MLYSTGVVPSQGDQKMEDGQSPRSSKMGEVLVSK